MGPPFDYGTLSAQRRLAQIFVQTAFYLPRALFETGEYRRAALSLQIAAEIQPDNPRVSFALARALARAGDRKRALAALAKAVEAGFDDRERIETDPDLAPIRSEAAFGRILEALRARARPGGGPWWRSAWRCVAADGFSLSLCYRGNKRRVMSG